MRMRKIAFGFAIAFGVGTVVLAGICTGGGQDVANDVAARLQGGAPNCFSYVSTNCTWSGGTGCLGTSGYSTATAGDYGYTTSKTACGGTCGDVALNWFYGCGSVSTVTALPPS